MVVDLDPFPPIEILIQEVLRERLPQVTRRVYSGVPSKPQYPLVTVRRIGGVPAVRERLDQAQIQIDSWGRNKSNALAVAHAARVEVHRMQGELFEQYGDSKIDAFVTGVVDSLGLVFLEDHVTGKDRYLFGVAVYAHSVP